jgi:hypothetical protein
MKYALVIATFAALAGSPAFAASSGCSTAPVSQWQPQSKLETMLKGQGDTVRQIKVEKGCYEVYATDKAGHRVNQAYNAQTLKLLANPEAGEN